MEASHMSQPLVSVIIPVYNGANYLREAIDSALAQIYPNIEIIVVNDGSTDKGETEEIAASYGQQIRYFQKDNGGVASALNLAIREMKGEYFSWLSHDDLYYPHKINRQLECLREHGDMKAIVHSDYDLLDENSKLITHVQQSKSYSIERLTTSVFPVLQGLIHGCSLLIHKSQFDRVGIFNEKLVTTQDYDLWFRMFRNQKTVYIPEPLIIGRLHQSQGSRTITCHDQERCQLHIDFIENLHKDEMIELYGSVASFYHRMCCFFKGGRMTAAYNFVSAILEKMEIPEELFARRFELQAYIDRLSNGNANRVCIFGAGEYGLRIYEELWSKLIQVDYFSDNNPEKWDSTINGVNCISPSTLKEDKEHTLIIVANRTPDAIVNQLKSEYFPYIVTKQEMDGVLFDFPPLRWITAMENN